MVHGERVAGVSYCTEPGQTSPDTDVVTCSECLFHIATEALEGTDRQLEALEAVRRIAELAHPQLRITTHVGPQAPAFSELG